jgi:hypothetical protein
VTNGSQSDAQDEGRGIHGWTEERRQGRRKRDRRSRWWLGDYREGRNDRYGCAVFENDGGVAGPDGFLRRVVARGRSGLRAGGDALRGGAEGGENRQNQDECRWPHECY